MVIKSPISFAICSFLMVFILLTVPINPVSANEVGHVLANGTLNVRSAPSLQGDIIGKLQDGDEVQIIERRDEWLKISSKLGNGFVHSMYIKVQAKQSGTNTKNTADNLNTAKPKLPTATNSSTTKISVYVNGELLKLPIEPPIVDGRVLVPFRGIGENLGISVKWLADTKQVEAIDANKKVLFTINKNKVLVNDAELAIDPAPMIVKESTVLPLRFFAESYGANVQWNEKERTVVIEQKSIVDEDDEVTDDREQPSSVNEEENNEVGQLEEGNNGDGVVEDGIVGDGPVADGPVDNGIRSTVLAVIEKDDEVEVYEEPSTDSNILGELEVGDSIRVYQKPSEKDMDPSEWVEIDYKNKLGYIESDAIRPYIETIKGKVVSTELNIREYPDTNSPTIGRLVNGQEVILDEFDGQWARIKHNGVWGYIHTGYVSMQKGSLPFSLLGKPKLETFDNGRSWLLWSKIGAVTTSHQLLADGVEITSSATNVEEWEDGNYHPAINRIEYAPGIMGSKIRIYFNPGYHFVVRHSANEVKITLLNSGLVGKRIVIDAGHGSHDPGAKGPSGLYEKEVNLAVSLKLADLLRNAGANVILTRGNDTFLALADRVKVAHDNDADAFVSVHSDSFKTTSQGSTTFYHSGKNPSWQQSKKLSDIAIKHVTSQLGTVNRGSNDKSLHVIRETEIPAILVEMAFLSNPNEEAMLKSDEFRQKAAQAIFESLVEFYQ